MANGDAQDKVSLDQLARVLALVFPHEQPCTESELPLLWNSHPTGDFALPRRDAEQLHVSFPGTYTTQCTNIIHGLQRKAEGLRETETDSFSEFSQEPQLMERLGSPRQMMLEPVPLATICPLSITPGHISLHFT